jgi:hypothetical protein
MSEEIKKGILLQILMIITAILLFVITFYFLVAINTKIKEAENIGEKKYYFCCQDWHDFVKRTWPQPLSLLLQTQQLPQKQLQKIEKIFNCYFLFKEQDCKMLILNVNYNVYPNMNIMISLVRFYYRNQRIVGYTATESLE